MRFSLYNFISIALSIFNFSQVQGYGIEFDVESNSENFQYRGVAIGGWLVLEPYITPSLFLSFNDTSGNESDIPVDEYHYCKQLGKEEAQERLQEHWSSFYNESDFEKIKSYGLNMVRIPVGYWSFEMLEDDPYVYGAVDYLDQAIEWCSIHDLKVLIDLHGAPNSQNGFDNSGLRNIGYPGWQNKTIYVEHTEKVLQQIYARYGNETYADTVIGIEILNEPLGGSLDMSKLKDFYTRTYRDAREIQTVNNTFVFHDAFQPISYWNDYKNTSTTDLVPEKYVNGTLIKGNYSESSIYNNSTLRNYNILIDHHHYEVFTVPGLNLTIEQHIDSIKSYTGNIRNYELDVHPAIVGEWLAALTDCTPWLNGVGLGARFAGEAPYDNEKIGDCSQINNWSKWTNLQKKNSRKWIEIQLDQYGNNTDGWVFWCFKTETSIEWDFNRLVELGLMPQPLTDRTYIVNGSDTDKKKSIGNQNNISWSVLALILISFFF